VVVGGRGFYSQTRNWINNQGTQEPRREKGKEETFLREFRECARIENGEKGF